MCVCVARWALLLDEFSYIIEPGKSMTHVDALSCYPLSRLMLIDAPRVGLLARIEKA